MKPYKYRDEVFVTDGFYQGCTGILLSEVNESYSVLLDVTLDKVIINANYLRHRHEPVSYTEESQ